MNKTTAEAVLEIYERCLTSGIAHELELIFSGADIKSSQKYAVCTTLATLYFSIEDLLDEESFSNVLRYTKEEAPLTKKEILKRVDNSILDKWSFGEAIYRIEEEFANEASL